MFRIKLVLIVIGGVLLYLAFEETKLARVAKSTPQTITCEALEANGPGDNAYIVLTDYLVGSNLVYETNSRAGSGWALVYVPAIPTKSAIAAAVEGEKVIHPKVIIKSNAVKSEKDIPLIAGRLEGMVINEIRSLSSEQKRLLSESYPGTDLDKCWIVEHGRRPGSFTKIGGLAGGGILLVLAGVGLMLRGRGKAA